MAGAMLSKVGLVPGSTLVTFSRAVISAALTGSLTVSGASANAASAIAESPIDDFATMPRSISAVVSLRSLAISSNDVPAAMRSRAALASSAFWNGIWST
ncbi:Uncharacterised protein [Mycobacterium tuberculosis]|nr:Uncharacterised protein [Mycobacterium tuberculosis]